MLMYGRDVMILEQDVLNQGKDTLESVWDLHPWSTHTLKAHVRNSAAWPTDAAYWSVLHKDRKALWPHSVTQCFTVRWHNMQIIKCHFLALFVRRSIDTRDLQPNITRNPTLRYNPIQQRLFHMPCTPTLTPQCRYPSSPTVSLLPQCHLAVSCIFSFLEKSVPTKSSLCAIPEIRC